MNWDRKRVLEVFFYFGFYFLTIQTLPPTIVGMLTLVIALVNLIRNPDNNLSNYILLFVSSIFYNALEGEVFYREFQRSESSAAFSASANLLGLFYLVQLLFTGKFRWYYFRWQRLDTLLVVFLLVVTLTSLLGRDYQTSMEELYRYPSFVAFYILTRITISDLRKVHEMISVFYASIIIVFLITLQKVFIGSQYGALVDFIFLMTPVVHLSLLDSKGWRTKDYFNIAILTIGSLSLLISDSRRVLMSIVIVWFSGLKMKQFINLALILLLPAFLVIGALDIGVKFRYGKSVEQLSDVFNSEQTGNEDVLRSLTTGRSILWEAGINMIIDNPIFGVGLENHVNLLPEYGGYTKIRIHNIFLDVTSQAGLLGLVVFLAILSNQLKELRKLRRSLFLRGFNYHQTLVYSLYISFIAVIVFSFFGGSMLLGKWGWFQVGFLSSVMVVLQKELK